MSEIRINGIDLPSPVDISIGDEIIWSSATGRSASGLMTGDIIAEKQTVNVSWGILTAEEMDKIKSTLNGTFLPCTVLGSPMTIYRSTLQSQYLGKLSDGITYYKSATVSLIQQ